MSTSFPWCKMYPNSAKIKTPMVARYGGRCSTKCRFGEKYCTIFGVSTVLKHCFGEKYCTIFGLITVLNAELAKSTVFFSFFIQYFSRF